jgi:hypothetical protein
VSASLAPARQFPDELSRPRLRGRRNGAALLVHRRLASDETPVLLACATAALAVAAEHCEPLLERWLRDESEVRREVAALAFVQVRAASGAARWIAWLEGVASPPELELGIRATATAATVNFGLLGEGARRSSAVTKRKGGRPRLVDQTTSRVEAATVRSPSTTRSPFASSVTA